MKGLIVYRILSILINTFSCLLALSLVSGLPVIFAQPVFAIVFFMMLCVVLYAWFANTFLKKVILKNETVSKKTKDLIQVNAIVSLVLSGLIVIPGAMLLADPKPYYDALDKMMDGKVTPEMAITQLWIFLVFFLLLIVHIVWTYMLIRKNTAYFKD